MDTVDASSDPSVSLMEPTASNRYVRRDSSLRVEEQATSTPLGNSAIQFNHSFSARDIHPQTAAPSLSGDIPRWKRILDVTCILLALPLWLPIVLLIALWIKIVSNGPLFFRQERIGYRGSRFMILKFRTMKCNVETTTHERHLEQLIQTDRPMTKLDASGDPRIIRGGRLLRATGLDELPQLFNVLRGEMSLVGPRPCTPNEFRRYQPWQQQRVNAAPGLTGYWQVNGKNKTTFTEMINLDIFYTKNMSWRLDLAIILQTVPAIVGQVLEARRAGEPDKRANSSMVSQRSRQCSQ
jgi:lipopolysaccharide/colanic/teichoic acid biosynthesis glycosyltransferase